MVWRAIVTAITLLAAASTFYLASRALINALRTRAVLFADRKYDIDKHPATVCVVAALWLSLIALMSFALVMVIGDLPELIAAIFPT